MNIKDIGKHETPHEVVAKYYYQKGYEEAHAKAEKKFQEFIALTSLEVINFHQFCVESNIGIIQRNHEDIKNALDMYGRKYGGIETRIKFSNL